jgi:TrpR family trp operon transcriptional repressor
MVKNDQLEKLIDMFLSIKTKAHMEDFLLGILTPKELEEIPMRLQIVKMLKKGVPQHQIAKELNIGVATVTRGSKEIQKGRFKVVK